MSWLSDQMTGPQEFVWRRRADVDLCHAGTSRWFRLSEGSADQFEAALQILDWLDDEFGDGASASVRRLMLPTETHAGSMADLSLGLLDSIGLQPPPAGRYLHEGQVIDVAHIDDRDDDDEALL